MLLPSSVPASLFIFSSVKKAIIIKHPLECNFLIAYNVTWRKKFDSHDFAAVFVTEA
jgi:hypothetical protein